MSWYIGILQSLMAHCSNLFIFFYIVKRTHERKNRSFCVRSSNGVSCHLYRTAQWLISAEKLDHMKPAGMSLIYIAFISLLLDEMVIALYPCWKKRVLNSNNHSTVMQTQRLFALNVCFSHLAMYAGMEILFPVTSLTVFFNTQHAHKSFVTVVKVQIPSS